MVGEEYEVLKSLLKRVPDMQPGQRVPAIKEILSTPLNQPAYPRLTEEAVRILKSLDIIDRSIIDPLYDKSSTGRLKIAIIRAMPKMNIENTDDRMKTKILIETIINHSSNSAIRDEAARALMELKTIDILECIRGLQRAPINSAAQETIRHLLVRLITSTPPERLKEMLLKSLEEQ